MFNTLSMAGTGTGIITVLNVALPLLGIEVPEGSVGAAVEATFNVIGFILLVWGQARRSDLIAGIIRK